MSRPSIDQLVTFIYTQDLAATMHFYEDVMGLSLVLDQGSCRIYRISADGFLGICESDTAPTQSRGIIITLATHDVDGWYHYLTERGVTFEKPPAPNPSYNIYHCFVRDPNGYLLEIQQFLDPAWPVPGNDL